MFGGSSLYTPTLGDEEFGMAEKPNIFAWTRKRRNLYPFLLTFSLLAAFACPIISAVRIVQDPSVEYWVGRECLAVLVVPLLIAVAHLWQARVGAPRFFAVLMSTILPGLIVIVVAEICMMRTNGITDVLMSTDCTTFLDKAKLEDAYLAALHSFDDCVHRVAQATNTTLEEAATRLSVDDCAEYQQSPDMEKYGREWAYLRRLEQEQLCSGFCVPGEVAIWSRDHSAKDPCSLAAGQTIKTRVRRIAQNMMALGFAVLVFSGLIIFGINEMVIGMGIDW